MEMIRLWCNLFYCYQGFILLCRGGAVTILRLCVNWPLQTMVMVPDYRSNSNPIPACSHGEKLWFRKEFQLHGGTASFGKLHYRKVTKAMFMECILR